MSKLRSIGIKTKAQPKEKSAFTHAYLLKLGKTLSDRLMYLEVKTEQSSWFDDIASASAKGY
ncbi:MAG: hypothetical protein KME54_09805 [Tolypothrix brevis GSE-NOS-MK-07-07A]|nr:hypothetical protein [Tolypothrix brevis GSE-NOS-MK-07-07A]